MKSPSPLWLLLGAVLSASAFAAPGTLLRNESLHTQPATTAPVSAQVSRGTPVDIVTRRGGWLQVRTARSQGWVRLLSVRAGQGGSGGAGLGDVVGVATRRSNPSRVVSVAGVRGLNEEELKQARFSPEELARMDNYDVTSSQARARAGRVGLVSVNVPALPRPQTRYEPSRDNNNQWPEN